MSTVEALLLKLEDKLKFKVAVEKRYFRLQQMKEICETVIATQQMDVAIFVVHAHDSRSTKITLKLDTRRSTERYFKRRVSSTR